LIGIERKTSIEKKSTLLKVKFII